MVYHIYGRVESQVVTFVGCVKNADIPADSILLQSLDAHPEVHWVKWSIRFRRTLKDKKALTHRYAKYFTNPTPVMRLYEEKSFATVAKEQNDRFLQFHEDNSHVLQDLIHAALGKQGEGRRQYSLDQLLGEVRWSKTEIEQGTDRVKVNANLSPWYSRVLQMVEPQLIGFFAVKSSMADLLVWIDGRTWQQFASEHADTINWKNPFEELPDSDWEYRG